MIAIKALRPDQPRELSADDLYRKPEAEPQRSRLPAALALAVTAIAAGAGAVFARKGMALLEPASLAPTETAQTIKEDIEWLRHEKARMTSATTLH